MDRIIKSKGISSVAFQAEVAWSLREDSYEWYGTSEYLINGLAKLFHISAPKFKYGRTARLMHGHYNYVTGELTLNSSGMNAATIIHEFAHHLAILRYNSRAHDKTFQRTHELVLHEWFETSSLSLERLQMAEQLEWWYKSNPWTYMKAWTDGISTPELFTKLATELPLRVA